MGYLCLAWRDEQTQKCDAADERSRIWYTDVDEEDNASEIEFLRKAIHQKDVGLRVQAVSAFNRFSVRARFAHQLLWNVDVKSSPNSGHSPYRLKGPLCAMKRHTLALAKQR